MAIPTPEPRVARFEKLAYGMFIHWGIYSQLGKGEWVQNQSKIPMEEYVKLKDTFTAKDFNAREIAAVARQSGMRYIVITTRHHDGFSLFDTRGLCSHDAPHSAAGRDLIAEFVEGCRAEDIVPCFYHTTLDWYQKSFKEDFPAYLEYLRKSVEVLCRNYGPVGSFWFDGNWSRPTDDWKEDELYGTIRKYQPETIIVNNTGLQERGKLGHPEIDSVTFEQGLPSAPNREGLPKYVAGEMCETMNTHWGIGSDDYLYKSPADIIQRLCACRKVGANYLLNLGPTAHGRIPDYEKAALLRAGDWVRNTGSILYEAKPSRIEGNGRDFALESGGKTYFFIHELPVTGDENVTFGPGKAGPRTFSNVHQPYKTVRWLDNDQTLAFAQDKQSGLFTFQATGYAYGAQRVVRIAVAE